MLDLLVTNGRVVTPHGAGAWEIAVEGERIVAVTPPGTFREAARTIDAAGMIVVPGGVEPHTHLAHRIMMQPDEIRAAVAKPNSSAPSSAAMATSRPVFSCPSVSTRMRPRRSFITSTCCVSARPSSHGMPACLIEVSGDAPVPPESPLMSTTSDLAFDTPAATVPTPTSATSFTLMRARLLEFFKS